VRAALLSGDRNVVQALHGMGGVGKTQLAIEYAHRFASGYDVVWWVNAEQSSLIGEQFTMLAARLGCGEQGLPLPLLRHCWMRRRCGGVVGYWVMIIPTLSCPPVIWASTSVTWVILMRRKCWMRTRWRGVAVFSAKIIPIPSDRFATWRLFVRGWRRPSRCRVEGERWRVARVRSR
jgi:NB-ARC domain